MNEIVLYPGNWLYNAGVVGFLRILDFGQRPYEFTDGSVRIPSVAFQDFGFLYFAYATKLALLEAFNFLGHVEYKRDKVLKKLEGVGEGQQVVEAIEKVGEELRQRIFALEQPTSWQDFARQVGQIVQDGGKSIERIFQQIGLQENYVGIKLQKIPDFIDSISAMKFAADYLGRFYFNKGVVANPKGKDPQRIEKFEKQYLSFLNGISFGVSGYPCPLCGQRYQNLELFSEFAEGDFSSLGVSQQSFSNVYNFFADGGVSYPIKCPLCQLILLCAFAGFERKPWFVREIDETDYIFVDYLDLGEAYRINNKLKASAQEVDLSILSDGRQMLNPYIHALEVVLETVGKKTQWTLGNILFVEIKVSPRKDTGKPHFVYFDFDRALSEAFAEFDGFKRLLSFLAFRYEVSKNVPVYLSTEVLKRLIQKRPVLPLALQYLAEKVATQDPRLSPLWSMIVLDFVVRAKRKQLKNVEEVNGLASREIYGILRGIRNCGARSFSLGEIESKKRFHIAQRLLSLIRGARKEDFCNELMRLYVIYEKPVPEGVSSLLYESEVVSFQEKALAFLTGFLNPEEPESQKDEHAREEVF